MSAVAGAAAGPTPAGARAPLVEVFHSIQGEGRFVGAPMTFVRVATCPLRCVYCDTPQSHTATAAAVVRLTDGARSEPNPFDAGRAAACCAEVAGSAAVAPVAARPWRVSITGGEPLAVPRFTAALGARLRARGARVHLETAAMDAAAFAGCAAVVDHLSADYKLPETLQAGAPRATPPGGAAFGDEHVRCCEIALQAGATVDVKVVLTAAVTAASLAAALARLRPLRERVLLVLQPVTPFGAVTAPLPPAALAAHTDLALQAGFDVRVLPQVHKQLGVC